MLRLNIIFLHIILLNGKRICDSHVMVPHKQIGAEQLHRRE